MSELVTVTSIILALLFSLFAQNNNFSRHAAITCFVILSSLFCYEKQFFNPSDNVDQYTEIFLKISTKQSFLFNKEILRFVTGPDCFFEVFSNLDSQPDADTANKSLDVKQLISRYQNFLLSAESDMRYVSHEQALEKLESLGIASPCINPRHLMEPLFFLVGGFITLLTKTPEISFLFFNLLTFSALLMSLIISDRRANKDANENNGAKDLKSGIYWAFPLLVGFFAFDYAFAAFFRQIVASSVCLLALMLIWDEKVRSGVLLFALAVLMHNSMLLFSPLIFVLWPVVSLTNFARAIIVILSATIFSVFAWYAINHTMLSNYKANDEIGSSIKYVFLGLFSLIALATFVIEKFYLSIPISRVTVFCATIASIIFASVIIFNSGPVERMSLSASIFIFILLAYWLEKTKVFHIYIQRAMFILIPTVAYLQY